MPRINSNIDAMRNAHTLKKSEKRVSKSLEKLSTGLKINHASDDAAGLSVSELLRMQSRGLAVGNRNMQDGMSVINIAEGALMEVGNMIQRMRELSVQSASDTLTSDDRIYTDAEVQQLVEEIDRITGSTKFNGMSLLDGSAPWGGPGTNGGVLHVGPNTDPNSDLIVLHIDSVTTNSLGVDTIDLTSQTSSASAIDSLDDAVDNINKLRAKLGAVTNRLEHALTNQVNVHQNTTAAESVIRDVDFASEISEKTKYDIMQQSSTAMLAQANSLPEKILSLLNI